MLLEEIKANLSSDEDGSSDDEPDGGGKKRIGKQSEESPADDGELRREQLGMFFRV
jgi:transcriptional regulator ATRX